LGMRRRGGGPCFEVEVAMIVDEFLDVVDEYDNVVGRSRRSDVHQRGLLHRSIHLLVFNGSGELLMQKRSMKKDEAPGKWCSSVAGHLDSGETYDDCVVREAKEEIGLELDSVPTKLFKIDAIEETGNEFTWTYMVNANGPFVFDPCEVTELQWFKLKEVDRLIQEKEGVFSSSFLEVFQAFISMI